MAEKNFEAFKETIERQFMRHPVVTGNDYTAWFARGDMSLDHLRHFTVQFSVFSNQFLLAALNRVINADSLQAARESKEILMNELGVIYNDRDGQAGTAPGGERAGSRLPDHDREGDPALVSTEGTVDGGTFRFQAAHFEWLLRFGQPLGLTFDDMGKRRHGTPSTLLLLRRAVPPLRQRRLQRGDGRGVCRRELGGGRLLEGADRRARESQARTGADAAARVLHLARQDRRTAQEHTCGTSCASATSRRSSARSRSSAPA